MFITKILLLPALLITASLASIPSASAAESRFSYEGKSSHFYCMEYLVQWSRFKHGTTFENVGEGHLLLWSKGDVVGEVRYDKKTNHCSFLLE